MRNIHTVHDIASSPRTRAYLQTFTTCVRGGSQVREGDSRNAAWKGQIIKQRRLSLWPVTKVHLKLRLIITSNSTPDSHPGEERMWGSVWGWRAALCGGRAEDGRKVKEGKTWHLKHFMVQGGLSEALRLRVLAMFCRQWGVLESSGAGGT